MCKCIFNLLGAPICIISVWNWLLHQKCGVISNTMTPPCLLARFYAPLDCDWRFRYPEETKSSKTTMVRVFCFLSFPISIKNTKARRICTQFVRHTNCPVFARFDSWPAILLLVPKLNGILCVENWIVPLQHRCNILRVCANAPSPLRRLLQKTWVNTIQTAA